MSIWSRIERRLTDLAGELLPDDLREQVDQARELLTSGETDEAIGLLSNIVDARPDHLGALSLLGVAYIERGTPEEARETFQRVLGRRSDLADARVGLAQACKLLGDLDAAITEFRAAVEAADGDREVLAVAYRGLGLCYRETGELDKAIRELRKAVAEAPRDELSLTALADALHAHPDVSSDEPKKYLGWALEGAPPALAHLLAGEIALHEKRVSEARTQYFAAAKHAEKSGRQGDLASALIGLADASTAEGDLATAHQELLRALDVDADRVELHARLAAIKDRSGSSDAALAHYDRAVELGADESILSAALHLAVRESDLARMQALSEALLERRPLDDLARVARGRVLAAAGENDAAESIYREVLETSDDAEAHLGLSALILEQDPTAAADHALAALRATGARARARELLAVARRRELGLPVDGAEESEPDLVAAIDALERLVLARTDLAHLAATTREAAHDFDRPLLVTVMGEFSSGKSTFVNAFIGAEVAPTGITPTTATINVVRHGRERGGRIIYASARTEDVPWAELFGRLRNLDAEEASSIRRVEILLPLDILERVNLVDTPGLNSILPEHEQVARDFIERADAVVWVFSAGQAGKKTEREALDAIRGQGVRVLGALNKIDQLSDADAASVLAMVDDELGDRLETIVPVSARRAAAGEENSNWEALESELESHFFARAKKLKASAARRRLRGLIASARDLTEARRGELETAADHVDDAIEQTNRSAERFAASIVDAERRQIATDLGGLYRDAAREVLELVLPRSLPFGSNKATPADRDYLISLLETRLEAALARSRRRVEIEVHQACAAAERAEIEVAPRLGAPGVGIGLLIDDVIQLLGARVYSSALAYLRGYLRGGYVDHFFRSDLPKLDLAEDAIYHALFRDSPDVDQLIAGPLASAGQEALASVVVRLSAIAGALRARAFDTEESCLHPLDVIERRAGLTPDGQAGSS